MTPRGSPSSFFYLMVKGHKFEMRKTCGILLLATLIFIGLGMVSIQYLHYFVVCRGGGVRGLLTENM